MKKIFTLFVFFLIILALQSKEIELEVLKTQADKYEIRVIDNYKTIKFDPYNNLESIFFYESGKDDLIPFMYGFNTDKATRIIRKGEILSIPIDLKLILRYAFSHSIDGTQLKGKYEVLLDYKINNKNYQTKPFYIIFKNLNDYQIQVKSKSDLAKK